MRKITRYLLAMMGAAFVSLSAGNTAMAAEVPAPFTADQLLQVVNTQCANITSVHGTMVENVQIADAETGISGLVTAVMDMSMNQSAVHANVALGMNIMGLTESEGMEMYMAVENGKMNMYTMELSKGVWEKTSYPITPEMVASMSQPMVISGVDTQNAVVTTDGLVYRITTVIDANMMGMFSEMFESSGINLTNTVMPVVIEIDAATLLPRSMAVGMGNIQIEGLESVSTSATAIVVYDGFNMHNNIVVPDAVKAAAK